ncbi:MAG: ABC transporter permease [Cyclobacteriaceae bacterium]|nr:MAG: ABC transporter permease [Cyclobacteriaceae bacterium]
MDYNGILVLLVSFIVLLTIGVPVAYSIGISGILTMLVSVEPLPAFTTFAHRMATSLDSFTLLAIPFFILAGNIMNSGGIAARLIAFARVLAGGLPGGLLVVNIIANILFGAISGSAAASASAIGSMMGPALKREGYDEGFSAAVNITSATTGLSIPPSNILIVYSLASGGVSITALFLAGYLPGILTGLAIMFMTIGMVLWKMRGARGVLLLMSWLFGISALVWLYAMIFRYGVSRFGYAFGYGLLALPVVFFVLYLVRFSKHHGAKVKALVKTFLDALPSLLMLLVLIGGIVAGFFTATEASAIAVLYSLVLSMLYRELKWQQLPSIMLNTVKTTSVVMLLIATSMALSWIMSYENIPQNVSEVLLELTNNPFVILLIINLVLLFVGIFMDMTPAVLIFTPIFLPVVTSQFGLSPVHFGIIMVLNLSIGLCTPPVGSVLFIGCGVAKIPITRVLKPMIPLFIAMICVLLLVTYVPQISLWLPEYFGY